VHSEDVLSVPRMGLTKGKFSLLSARFLAGYRYSFMVVRSCKVVRYDSADRDRV
jgi:hypothetical protein